jgi:hypothetical protein
MKKERKRKRERERVTLNCKAKAVSAIVCMRMERRAHTCTDSAITKPTLSLSLSSNLSCIKKDIFQNIKREKGERERDRKPPSMTENVCL